MKEDKLKVTKQYRIASTRATAAKKITNTLTNVVCKTKKTPSNLTLKMKLAKLWQKYLIKAQQTGGWQLHAPEKKEKNEFFWAERATKKELRKDRGGSGNDRSSAMVKSHTSCLRDDGHEN